MHVIQVFNNSKQLRKQYRLKTVVLWFCILNAHGWTKNGENANFVECRVKLPPALEEATHDIAVVFKILLRYSLGKKGTQRSTINYKSKIYHKCMLNAGDSYGVEIDVGAFSPYNYVSNRHRFIFFHEVYIPGRKDNGFLHFIHLLSSWV